jgi:predicted phosphodiesterase
MAVVAWEEAEAVAAHMVAEAVDIANNHPQMIPRTGLAMPGPVRFVSDLHLGHDMCTLRSTSELWPLIDGAGTVVLNGDTTEDQSSSFSARSEDMYAEVQALCTRAGAELVCLNGNHDPTRWPHDWLDLAGGKLFVTHGHVLLRMVSPWSRKLDGCRADLERIYSEYTAEQFGDIQVRFEIARRCSLAMPPSETRQESRSLLARAGLFFRETWPPKRPWEVLKVWARLPSIAGRFVSDFRPSARAMLFGHTHRAACWRRKGRLLVNTGGFVTFSRALLAELSEGRLSIFDVEERKSERRRGRALDSELLDD